MKQPADELFEKLHQIIPVLVGRISGRRDLYEKTLVMTTRELIMSLTPQTMDALAEVLNSDQKELFATILEEIVREPISDVLAKRSQRPN